MSARVRREGLGRTLLGAAVSVISGAAVWVTGRDLALPRGWTGGAVARWYESTGPLVGVFAVSRIILIGWAALMAAAFLSLSVALAGRSGSRLLSARRVPGVGAVLRLAIGLSATGAAVAACGSGPPGIGGSAAWSPPAAPLLTNTGAGRSVVPLPPGGTARLPPSVGRSRPAPPTVPASRAVPAQALSRPAREWRVRPGDSLWSIAEATAGGPPARVAAYWAELVNLNRPHLPDPADPSLLFPGDIVVLPPNLGGPA